MALEARIASILLVYLMTPTQMTTLNARIAKVVTYAPNSTKAWEMQSCALQCIESNHLGHFEERTPRHPCQYSSSP